MAGLKFTLVVTLDEKHMAQWHVTWPTWVRHRPEIMQNPLLIIADGEGGYSGTWARKCPAPHHPDCRIATWTWPDPDNRITQREKMLTAIVRSVPRYVETPWWLKVDTDVVAMHGGQWYEDEWFEDNPAIISAPWGYTKPAHYIELLDDWADEHFELKGYPRLNIPPVSEDSGVVRHKRIASWCMFGSTEFARWASNLVDKCPRNNSRLPVPSQDTYHWFVAKRAGLGIRRVSMKKKGWQVKLNMKAIKQLASEAMGEPVS